MTLLYLLLIIIVVGAGILICDAIHNDFASCKDESERREKGRDYFEWYVIGQIINDHWKGGGKDGR